METLCDCFKQLIQNGSVHFFSVHEPNPTILMPYIPNSNYRYNNCPCCGKEVRSLELTIDEFSILTTPST